MKTAVVSGHSRGIGKALTLNLLQRGFSVIGLSRSRLLQVPENSSLTQISCDLRDHENIDAALRHINAITKNGLDVLINNAGIGYFAPHETHQSEQIREMVAVNLTAPLLLTNGLLRSLRQQGGLIINVGSASSLETSPFGGAYAATKAGLKHFGEQLFKEVRKNGLRVCTLIPDLTTTSFYDEKSFQPSAKIDTALTTDDIERCMDFILDARSGLNINEIIIRPQRLEISKKTQSSS